jgi:hypothetical protein
MGISGVSKSSNVKHMNTASMLYFHRKISDLKPGKHLVHPEFINARDLAGAVKALDKHGKKGLSEEVQLETLDERACVQMLHVGSYERENETVDQMIAFAASKGLLPHGRHHEIYISDPRRVAPEKLKTILRIPVEK